MFGRCAAAVSHSAGPRIVETDQDAVRGVRDRHHYEFARIDLGWADPKIGLEYEGRHHQTDRLTYERDIRRLEELSRLGWIIIRVTAADTTDSVLIRLNDAWARRM